MRLAVKRIPRRALRDQAESADHAPTPFFQPLAGRGAANCTQFASALRSRRRAPHRRDVDPSNGADGVMSAPNAKPSSEALLQLRRPSPPGIARVGGLRPRMLSAIACLVAGATQAEAAAEAGVNERTLRRWMDDPGFLLHLDAAHREVLDEVVTRLQWGAIHAIETLQRIHLDRRVAVGSRIAAARTLLEHAVRAGAGATLTEGGRFQRRGASPCSVGP